MTDCAVTCGDARAALIVLADSRTSLPCSASTEAESEGSVQTSFREVDSLESCSLFFEQFHIQDARSTARITDVLGGADALASLAEAMRTAGRTVEFLTTENVPSEFSDVPALRSGTLDASSGLQPSAADLTVLWCAVDSSEATDDSLIRNCFSTAEANRSHLTTVILWLRRQPSPALPDPFESGFDQQVIQAPLWICGPDVQAGRSQVLCGSHDLLSTLRDILGLIDAQADACKGNSFAGLPKSLLQLHQNAWDDRILKIVVDSGMACRAPQYLYLRFEATQDSDEPQRYLYLKPDDYWNINDVLGSHEAIADLLEAELNLPS